MRTTVQLIPLAAFAGATVLALGQTASAGNGVIYDNGVTPNTGLASQLDTVYPFEAQVADDFSLDQDYFVTDVHWTGLQFNDPPDLGQTQTFNIFFYADNGAGTSPFYTGDGTTSPAADAFNMTQITVAADGPAGGPWAYSADLDTSFVAEAGTTYWISIQLVGNFPPQWGWEGDNAGGGNAVQGFPLLGTPFWTGVNAEMNFELTGELVPAPGALALLGLAGLAGRRRRRA